MERHYPDLLAVDPSGCGCTECLIGEYAPQEEFIQHARGGDVLMLVTGTIANNTYLSDAALHEEVIARSPHQEVRDIDLDDFSITGDLDLGDIDAPERHYPDLLAVDPHGCGCTECLTGEYEPQEDFERYAKVADLLAVLAGEIGDNSFAGSPRQLVSEVVRRSDDRDVKAFGRRLGL